MSRANEHITKIMGVLHAAYPNYVFADNTILVYCEMLADLDPYLLEQAAKAHLVTGKFFPTIAELRERVANLVERACSTPGAAEAWGEVTEKMRIYGNTLYGGSVPEFSSPIVTRVVGYFGWNDLCLSENSVADRARFLQAYEIELTRAREDMRFLPETHDAVALMSSNRSSMGIKYLTERLTSR